MTAATIQPHRPLRRLASAVLAAGPADRRDRHGDRRTTPATGRSSPSGWARTSRSSSESAVVSSEASCTPGPCRLYNALHTLLAAAPAGRAALAGPLVRLGYLSPRWPGLSTSASTGRRLRPADARWLPALLSRRGARARQIVEVALELLEEEGPDALSMRRIADRIGIRAPSIYEHVPDKRALEAAIISVGFERQAEAFEAAVDGRPTRSRRSPRSTARSPLAHPHLYRLMTERELHRELLTPGVEDRAGRTVYEAAGRDPDLARAAWAFAHGMTILELDNRFPPGADLDAAWARGLDAFRSQRPVINQGSARPRACRRARRGGSRPRSAPRP